MSTLIAAQSHIYRRQILQAQFAADPLHPADKGKDQVAVAGRREAERSGKGDVATGDVGDLARADAQVEGVQGMRPALVSIEGGWQLGYQLEELKDGWVAVFLPQSPTPMSGNVMYLPAARVRLLEIPIPEAMMLVKRMGVGSAATLRTVDLTPVAEG